MDDELSIFVMMIILADGCAESLARFCEAFLELFDGIILN